VGRPVFDWLSVIGFWAGLLVAVKWFRLPRYLFLLVALLFLWLPAPLSIPAIHSLRLSGLRPIYYMLMSVGLLTLAYLVVQRLPWQSLTQWVGLILFVLVLSISGGLTIYDYFGRWANDSQVYKSYEGPLVDLTRYLMTESTTNDVLLPFQMYIHPAVRLLLHDKFYESDTPPPFNPDRPAVLVTVPDFSLLSEARRLRENPAYIWLTHDTSGQGVAFVSRLSPDLETPASRTRPFLNPHTKQAVAFLTSLENVKPALPMLADSPSIQPLNVNWDKVGRLIGYEILPDPLPAGQVLLLNLYWQAISKKILNYKILIQLINSQAGLVGEWKQTAPSDQLLHWRPDGLTLTQHQLWISPETPSGPYLLRVAVVDIDTGQPLMPQSSDALLLDDPSWPRLLFYIAPKDADPRQPPNSLPAQLDDQIELLGYSSPSLGMAETLFLRFHLYWRANRVIDKNHLTFVQLLNDRGQAVASLEVQPLSGQYATSFWQPDQIVVDEINLSLPGHLSPGNYRLIIGMYDPVTKSRLPAFDVAGHRLAGDMIILTQANIP
jgi:hypothetical protein